MLPSSPSSPRPGCPERFRHRLLGSAWCLNTILGLGPARGPDWEEVLPSATSRHTQCGTGSFSSKCSQSSSRTDVTVCVCVCVCSAASEARERLLCLLLQCKLHVHLESGGRSQPHAVPGEEKSVSTGVCALSVGEGNVFPLAASGQPLWGPVAGGLSAPCSPADAQDQQRWGREGAAPGRAEGSPGHAHGGQICLFTVFRCILPLPSTCDETVHAAWTQAWWEGSLPAASSPRGPVLGRPPGPRAGFALPQPSPSSPALLE